MSWEVGCSPDPVEGTGGVAEQPAERHRAVREVPLARQAGSRQVDAREGLREQQIVGIPLEGVDLLPVERGEHVPRLP